MSGILQTGCDAVHDFLLIIIIIVVVVVITVVVNQYSRKHTKGLHYTISIVIYIVIKFSIISHQIPLCQAFHLRILLFHDIYNIHLKIIQISVVRTSKI
jgi:hypothetical protein